MNTQVATVDENGVIDIINFGKVRITVKDKNDKMKYRYDITVLDNDVASLELTPTQLELKTGDTYQLILKYISKEKPESIKWVSSNPDIVSVDDRGIVTGLKEGKSIVKVIIDSSEKECVINVSNVNNKVDPNYTVREPEQVQPEPQPQPQPQPQPEPKKDDKPQAVVTTNKEEEKKESVVESITSDVLTKNVYVNDTYKIVTVIKPSDAKTTLTYKSSNESVATVTDKGLVKGISKGTALITVTSANNKSYEMTIIVNEVVITPTSKKYTATISPNGANVSNNTVSCTTTLTNCKVTLPSFTRDGYTIIGYSTNPNATTAEYKIGDSVSIYSDTVFYPITGKTVTATFQPGNYLSSTSASCTMYNLNNSCNITTPSINRPNYASLGFNTDSNASSGSIGANSNTSISDNITYYAITRINQDGILAGCTGWAAGNIKYYSAPNSGAEGTLNSGTAFTIEGIEGKYFKVAIPGISGYKYVLHDYVMINLSDYIPSIVYNITNASSSIYRTSGMDIPGITGTKLYTSGQVYNIRLRRYEYMTPMTYSTANLLLNAQNRFKSDGYRLKLYDTYRPHSVTVKIYNALTSLYNSNKTVKDNIDYSYGLSGTRYYWGPGYFLANGVSRHNLGVALDGTLVNSSGQELEMPTAMHELSTKAIKYYSGNVAQVPGNYAKEMNDNAKYYDRIMTSVGFNTISGEWWHFQENVAANRITGSCPSGCDFQVTNIYSY